MWGIQRILSCPMIVRFVGVTTLSCVMMSSVAPSWILHLRGDQDPLVSSNKAPILSPISMGPRSLNEVMPRRYLVMA
ncbi:hypothetical protein BS47DRAFT_116475 [Hydnum rufescens UP504]|uniref:Uncharacterized protein n=1 Tax=Hydnum rufescens UP504 TaxID=1448309 RepID=A0A9P6AQL4_9AGAM|nr:hypothetical protein BS47DRAFT_116475 [Hydnum rufescens UP504]